MISSLIIHRIFMSILTYDGMGIYLSRLLLFVRSFILSTLLVKVFCCSRLLHNCFHFKGDRFAVLPQNENMKKPWICLDRKLLVLYNLNVFFSLVLAAAEHDNNSHWVSGWKFYYSKNFSNDYSQLVINLLKH